MSPTDPNLAEMASPWKDPRLERSRPARRAAARRARVRAAKEPKGAALVGDVAWRDTSSALDVDEARMQRFLDADPRRRENFSVQDMLDGRLSAEDPLGDLISD